MADGARSADDAEAAEELLCGAINSSAALLSLLRRLAAAAEPLPPAAADATAALRAELSSLQDGAASHIGARLLRSRDVAALLASSLAPSGSRAAAARCRRLSTPSAPPSASPPLRSYRRVAVRSPRARASLVREYLRLLLTGTHRLPAAAATAVAADAAELRAWCADATAPFVGFSFVEADGEEGAVDDDDDDAADAHACAVELSALMQVEQLLAADADDFAAAYVGALALHPDAGAALAEAVVARRPDLAKEKREILDACAAAAADVGGAESGVFADILPADGGAASGLLERMKEGGATASGLLKEGGAGLERMFSRGMKWLDEG